MSGLFALLLASKGLAQGAVLLTPAAPAGILALRYSVVKIFSGILSWWGFWRKPMKLSPSAANLGLFHKQPDEVRAAHYQGMVFESSRAAAEIAFWFLDVHKSTKVESQPDSPIMILVGQDNRITPADICHKIACRFNANFQLLTSHAHELHSEPDWEKIAEQADIWINLEVCRNSSSSEQNE